MFDTALAEAADWKTTQLENLRIARMMRRCGAPTAAASVAAEALRLEREREECKLTDQQRKEMRFLVAAVAN